LIQHVRSQFGLFVYLLFVSAHLNITKETTLDPTLKRDKHKIQCEKCGHQYEQYTYKNKNKINHQHRNYELYEESS
jgi:hypothetical protein